jgi:hypothetical protein
MFDYLNSAPAERNPARTQAQQYRDEARDRAALLRRLDRTADEATARIWGNLAWEFELSKAPPLTEEEVRGIVAAVFAGR